MPVVRHSIFSRPAQLLPVIMVLLGGLLSGPLHGQSSSPGGSSPPQQKLASAKVMLSRAHASVKQNWTLLKQSRDQLLKAQKDYDAVIRELREENTIDPLIRDSAIKVNEARDELEKQHGRALSPLRLSFSFNQLQRENAEMSVRLDDLLTSRARADRDRIPFDPQKQLLIGRLSLDLLKLQDDLAAMEDELLDDHEGYQAANVAMDQALDEAAQAMKATRELRHGNPRKQEAHKAMLNAYADAAAKGKAYAEARRQRTQWASAVVAAQNETVRTKR